MDFYTHTLKQLRIDPKSTVLAVCAGQCDADNLGDAGLNPTISNLDDRCNIKGFAWSRQDVEALTYPDRSFDWAVCHAGLHHCMSPHKGLLEMCRVSRKGVLVLESRDSLMMRAAVKFGVVEEYEFSAVISEGGKSGGLRNGPIPNFVYRWTEREVKKTIESAYPHRHHDYRFFYGLQVPQTASKMAGVIAKGISWITPRQCNRFGFAVTFGDTKTSMKHHVL